MVDDELDVVVGDLTPADVARVCTWRYGGPWAVYDGREKNAHMMTAENGYHAIANRRTGVLLGYLCLGAEARVTGIVEESGVVDVGIGLDPGNVGRRTGWSTVNPCLEWIEHRYGPTEMRAVVQSWNERSLRLCRRLGFEIAGHHAVGQADALVDYVILLRSRGHPAPPDVRSE